MIDRAEGAGSKTTGAGENSRRAADAPARLPQPRSTEERTRRIRAAKDAPKRLARSFVQLKSSINPAVLALTVLVLAAVVVSVATPMRNYFQQRAQIAEVNAQIERQEAEKRALTEEIEKYDSEAYLKEQARTRLGLVEPGETAYRLLDPGINSGADYVPGEVTEVPEAPSPWYSQLWGAIATPPASEKDPADAVPPPEGESPNLPIAPEP